MSRHITSAISQIFGKFANKKFSKGVQTFINKSYINLMSLDMSEFQEASSYESLNALFTRKLNQKREFSHGEKDFISPCDAWISECGDLKKEYALQIKGMEYKTDEFLGEEFSQEEKSLIYDGKFINFYLSPKDYHRYHIPIDLQVLKVVHIPGKFYPVNLPSLKKKINLFVENERVILQCQTQTGKIFYMVLVSALNVGVMQVSFESRIKTNTDALHSSIYKYKNLHLKKGEDFGCFEMGSTIIILCEKDMLDIEANIGDNVKFSQTVARLLV